MSDIFDQKRIKRLIELMTTNGLSELDLQQGDLRIQLKRNSPAAAIPAFAVPPQYVQPAGDSPAAVAPKVQDDADRVYIKSPMVGTFYASSNPESPPFVKVDDTVVPEKTVCLIEAMKVYNEIQAELSGKIVAVLAANGSTVEFGQPLFQVEV